MTKRILWILALVPFLMFNNACKPTPGKAKTSIEKKQFHSAAEEYAYLYAHTDNSKEKLKYAELVGECYKNASQYKKAVVWYKKASACTSKVHSSPLLHQFAFIIVLMVEFPGRGGVPKAPKSCSPMIIEAASSKIFPSKAGHNRQAKRSLNGSRTV